MISEHIFPINQCYELKLLIEALTRLQNTENAETSDICLDSLYDLYANSGIFINKTRQTTGHIITGLSRQEAAPLIEVACELLRNTIHGFGIDRELGPVDFKDQFDQALEYARRINTEAAIRLRLRFDDELNKGLVSVSHPIIAGTTPDFNLEEAIKRRKNQRSEHSVLPFGALFEIVDDAGILRFRMLHAGIEPGRLEHIDTFADCVMPSRGMVRIMTLPFSLRRS